MTEIVYRRPRELAGALNLLSDEGARPLAGGASLVAMMNARLIAPRTLVSLRDIDDLKGIVARPDSSVRIGAMARHCQTAVAIQLSGTLSALRLAACRIANPPVRNMGTMGGSVAFADPGADYPPALVAVGAEVEIASPGATRRMRARDFFVDWYTTHLEPGELVIAIHLPAPRRGIGLYHKLARVAGDFATVSVAMSAGEDGDVSLAIGGCGPVPLTSDLANAELTGRLDDAAAVRRAAEILTEMADPVDDARASADYRRVMIQRMVARAAAEAVQTEMAT